MSDNLAECVYTFALKTESKIGKNSRQIKYAEFTVMIYRICPIQQML